MKQRHSPDLESGLAVAADEPRRNSKVSILSVAKVVIAAAVAILSLIGSIAWFSHSGFFVGVTIRPMAPATAGIPRKITWDTSPMDFACPYVQVMVYYSSKWTGNDAYAGCDDNPVDLHNKTAHATSAFEMNQTKWWDKSRSVKWADGSKFPSIKGPIKTKPLHKRDTDGIWTSVMGDLQKKQLKAIDNYFDENKEYGPYDPENTEWEQIDWKRDRVSAVMNGYLGGRFFTMYKKKE